MVTEAQLKAVKSRVKAAQFKRRATALAQKITNLVNAMPHQGNKEADSQKIGLLNALGNLDSCITGTTAADFIEQE